MHTKGVWKAKIALGIWQVTSDVGDYGAHLAMIFGRVANGEAEANAHLMALSPRMFELLKRMVEGGWSTAIAIEAKEITEEVMV